jgi:hypothetical protein
MDRAVLDAYGWTKMPVPPYGTPVTADDRRALEEFEDDILDELFALNEKLAEDERRRGVAKAPRRAIAAEIEPASEAASASATAPPKSAPRHKGPGLKKTSVPPPPAPKRKSAGGSRKR